jgi:hypothetical protein
MAFIHLYHATQTDEWMLGIALSGVISMHRHNRGRDGCASGNEQVIGLPAKYLLALRFMFGTRAFLFISSS